MIWFLRILVSLLFLMMATSVTQSSLSENILEIPAIVTHDPWFITTMFDVYTGLLLFYIWICFREKAFLLKILWLPLLILLGNVATTFYAMLILWQLPSNSSAKAILLGNKTD